MYPTRGRPLLAVLGGLAAAAVAAAGLAWIYRSKAPRGKGFFVRSLVKCSGFCKTPEAMAAKLRELGIDWVALAGEDESGQVATIYPSKLPAYVKALKRAGIKVWIWGWPTPERTDQFAAQVGGLARELDAAGVIVNAEKPYYSPKHADHAREVMRKTKAASGGKPIGLTSYGGGPPWHPRFPWAAFVETSDFGVPQIYDSQHRLPRDYPSDAVAAWKRAGFRTIVPIWGASSAHTPMQMLDIASRTPITDKGAGWWTLDHALHNKDRTAAVAAYILPSGRQEVAIA